MKMLIIKPSSLGDIIHALPFLKAVKDSFTDARVDWVISRNLKGLIENNPLINEVIVFDKDSWKKIKNLPWTINEMSLLKKILKSRNTILQWICRPLERNYHLLHQHQDRFCRCTEEADFSITEKFC
jgi:ADP-heptose:LPS heptosyltransferase